MLQTGPRAKSHANPRTSTQASQAASEPSAEVAVRPYCFFLSQHTYVCEFDDGAIILDVRSDTYLGIDAQYLSNLRACIGIGPIRAEPIKKWSATAPRHLKA